MFKKMLKNERGLTLIELLAVVVILGIIAAIAVPSIGNVIQNSKEDAVHADALQVVSAAKLYTSSNEVSGTIVYSNKTTTNTTNTLDDFVDIDSNYKVTIGKNTDGKYEFTKIKVTKGTIVKYYEDEDDLRTENASNAPSGY